MTDELYADITSSSNPLNISVSVSHTGQVATASFDVEDTDLELGNSVTIDMGYTDEHENMFTGYVKDIQIKEPDRWYTVTCSDVLIRATEHYIVSTNPEIPMTRQNIDAALLVRDVFAEAGLTDFDYDETYFICGINTPIEIQLTTSYDFAKYVADLIAWNFWADRNGTVNFFRRWPWVTDEDVSIGTIPANQIINLTYGKNDKNLRNRVIVWGSEGIFAEASEVSPYLPEDFYKTVICSGPQIIDTQANAQLAADYNLEAFNKLTYQLTLTTRGRNLYYPRSTINVTYPYITGATKEWYIYATEHSWNANGYTTALTLRDYT